MLSVYYGENDGWLKVFLEVEHAEKSIYLIFSSDYILPELLNVLTKTKATKIQIICNCGNEIPKNFQRINKNVEFKTLKTPSFVNVDFVIIDTFRIYLGPASKKEKISVCYDDYEHAKALKHRFNDFWFTKCHEIKYSNDHDDIYKRMTCCYGQFFWTQMPDDVTLVIQCSIATSLHIILMAQKNISILCPIIDHPDVIDVLTQKAKNGICIRLITKMTSMMNNNDTIKVYIQNPDDDSILIIIDERFCILTTKYLTMDDTNTNAIDTALLINNTNTAQELQEYIFESKMKQILCNDNVNL